MCIRDSMYTEIVAKCYTAYQKELRQSEAMDFDDLIMLTPVSYTHLDVYKRQS